jgi:predicted aspartyl protease
MLFLPLRKGGMLPGQESKRGEHDDEVSAHLQDNYTFWSSAGAVAPPLYRDKISVTNVHTRLRRMTALLCVSLALTSVAAQTVGKPALKYNDMSDNTGVIKAVETGDVEALLALEKSPPSPLTALFAKAARARIGMDFQASTAAANQCIEESQKQKNTAQELACSMLKAGNELILDHPGEWARQLNAMRTKFYPLLRQSQGPSFALSDLEKLPNYAPFLQFKDNVAIEGNSGAPWSLGIHVLKKGPLSAVSTIDPMAVEVRSGQTRFDAVLDTAGLMSLLNTQTAEALGVHTIPHWISTGDGDTGLGTLPSLSIGQVHLRNVPVAVGSSAIPNVIGLSTLRQLGQVTFSSKVVVVGADAPARCQTHPLSMRSNLIGTSPKLIVPIEVNGQPVRAVFDTGFTGVLDQYGTDDPDELNGKVEQTMQITAKGPVSSTYVVKSKHVALGDTDQQVAVHVRAAQSGVAYVAGLRLLDGSSAYIDFNRRVMCFGR